MGYNQGMNTSELIMKYPLLEKMINKEEVTWINDRKLSCEDWKNIVSVSQKDIDEAESLLRRFAPFIQKAFPETASTNGIIESPTVEIPAMKKALNQNLRGKLLLKLDSELPIAGSVKARGGIYEILKHAEDLAMAHGMISREDDHSLFADERMRSFLSHYSIHVGSTGNLGLSIGIISAALGFDVSVHMSADARQWKKDLLRAKGARVIEYEGDYAAAVSQGRKMAAEDPNSYFVDDENSINLFLGYATAGRRLARQLDEMNITIDHDHPLIVYLPCGVGGAPGGIACGLKHVYGDDLHVYFTEPVNCCSMLLGVMTGLHENICVQDVGLSGKTEADGLAVPRPSKLAGHIVAGILDGIMTVDDSRLYDYLRQLWDQEGIFIEPSSCAGFAGPDRIVAADPSVNTEGAVHIVWATGGSLVPQEIREQYYKKN